VVAVMGVVNVMGSVGSPPAVLGKMIGGALVGTFLGILISYGFVEPVAKLLEQKAARRKRSIKPSRWSCWPPCPAMRRRWRSNSVARRWVRMFAQLYRA
jgi:hypothetical protein